jgi:hypothetical protein
MRGRHPVNELETALSPLRLGCALYVAFILSACDQKTETQKRAESAPAAREAPPSSIPMGGSKSVTRFFVTSKGPGKGGDLGGIAGADAHCQALAQAQGAGDHTWRAYLRRRRPTAGAA